MNFEVAHFLRDSSGKIGIAFGKPKCACDIGESAVVQSDIRHVIQRKMALDLSDISRQRLADLSLTGDFQYARDTLLTSAPNTAGLYSDTLKQLLIWNLPDRAEMLRARPSRRPPAECRRGDGTPVEVGPTNRRVWRSLALDQAGVGAEGQSEAADVFVLIGEHHPHVHGVVLDAARHPHRPS